MRILFINNFLYQFGGVETCLFNQVKILHQYGHQILFFCAEHPENIDSDFKKFFVPYKSNLRKCDILGRVDAAINSIYSSRARKNLKKLIDKYKPDIAHIHNLQHHISPSVIYELRKHGIPIVMSLHSPKMVCAGNSLFNFSTAQICEKCKGGKYYQAILNRCMDGSLATSLIESLEIFIHHKILRIFNQANLFISPSKFLIDKLKELGFNKKVVNIPNFVLLSEYAPKYDYSDKAIVYVGRLSLEKGVHVLLDAIKGMDVILKIIGAGNSERYLKNKAEKENIKNVRFIGYLDQERLKKEMSESLFTVLPSICYENSPLSVLESFALGRPVIASAVGGIQELVRNNETGFLFECGDVAQLRDRIKFLLQDHNLCLRLGKNARIWVENNLSERTFYERIIKQYSLLTLKI